MSSWFADSESTYTSRNGSIDRVGFIRVSNTWFHKPAPDARVTLEVLAGDTVVQATALTSADVWNRILLDPIPWRDGTRLGFRVATSSEGTVLLNRARLDWSDGDGV